MQSALSVRSWSKNLFSFFGISMPERLKHSHDESYLMCSAQYSMLPEMRSKSILRCEILLWFEYPQGNEERFKMQNFSWFGPGCVHQWIVERLASTNLLCVGASDTSLCDSYLEDWGYWVYWWLSIWNTESFLVAQDYMWENVMFLRHWQESRTTLKKKISPSENLMQRCYRRRW